MLLSQHITQTAESEGLAGLKFLSITSAQITGVPIRYEDMEETLGELSTPLPGSKTKQQT